MDASGTGFLLAGSAEERDAGLWTCFFFCCCCRIFVSEIRPTLDFSFIASSLRECRPIAEAKDVLTETLGGVRVLADPVDFAGEALGVEGFGGGVIALSETRVSEAVASGVGAGGSFCTVAESVATEGFSCAAAGSVAAAEIV